jgi:hypothetical protein
MSASVPHRDRQARQRAERFFHTLHDGDHRPALGRHAPRRIRRHAGRSAGGAENTGALTAQLSACGNRGALPERWMIDGGWPSFGICLVFAHALTPTLDGFTSRANSPRRDFSKLTASV